MSIPVHIMNSIMISVNSIFAIAAILGLIVFFRTEICRSEIKRKQFCEVGLVAVISVALGYLCLLTSKHFSVDSFNLVFDPSAYWDLQLGRYTNCGSILLSERIGIDRVINQHFYGYIWMLAMIVSVSIVSASLVNCMKIEDKKKIALATISVALAYVNVFVMELMLFPEYFEVSIIGQIALALSIYFVTNLRKACKFGISLFYLLIAMGNYQSYVGIYVVFALTGILLISSKIEHVNIWKEGIAVLLIGGGSSVFNVLLVKILIRAGIIVDSGRGMAKDMNTIMNNVRVLIEYQKGLWTNATGLLPNYLMPLIGIVCIILIGVVLKKLSYVHRLYFLAMLVGSYILAFAPHIIENRIILTPRSNIAFWAVIASVFLCAIGLGGRINLNVSNKLIYAVAVCLVINVFSMQDIAANTRATNAADFIEADQVCSEIMEYEQNSGETVTKIAVCNDTNPTVYHEFSKYKNENLGARIMITGYSCYRLVGYRMGRAFTLTDMNDEIYSEYFADRNWDCLKTTEQLVFKGDTMYWVLY